MTDCAHVWSPWRLLIVDWSASLAGQEWQARECERCGARHVQPRFAADDLMARTLMAPLASITDRDPGDEQEER